MSRFSSRPQQIAGAPLGARPYLPLIQAQTRAQGGVVSRNQLLATGLSEKQIADWSGIGWLRREARWVYSLAGAEVRQLGRLWAAVLSTGGDAAVAGLQAIDRWDLTSEVGSPVEVVVSDRCPDRQPGIKVRRTRLLLPEDVVALDDLRVVSPARAIFDHAGQATDQQLDRWLDRAVHLRLFERPAFDRLFEEWGRAPGRARLAAAIERLDATSGHNRTDLERALIRLILDGGLVRPATNTYVHGWEVDVHWIGTRAIVEADGDRYHSSPAQIAADRAKRRALEALGFVIKRFDYVAVTYEPERTLDRVEQFRAANTAPPVPR